MKELTTMKKGFSAVLLLLFIAVTAAYGQTIITETITDSGDFPDGTIVNISADTGWAVAISSYSLPTISFLGSSHINVTQNGTENLFVVNAYGGSINFAGVANITAYSSSEQMGIYNFGFDVNRYCSMLFDSDLILELTAGGGNTIGLNVQENSTFIVNGVTDITIETSSKDTDALMVGIISGTADNGNVISFSDLNLKLINTGKNTVTFGVFITDSCFTVDGVADITIEVTDEGNTGGVYGVLASPDSDISFGAGSSVKITSSGTGAVYGVYISDSLPF